MPEYPRENLIRMSTVIRMSDEGRTLIGTPIVFNEWTVIDGWEGHFKERILPGAVDKTLKERGNKIKVLYNHGFDPFIGEKPLGKPSVQDARDDALHVEVPLADTSYNADIIALLRADVLGMSFRFGVISDEWDNLDADDDSLPERSIKEIRLYEYGPVTFPAYEAATVGIRSRSEYDEYRQRKDFLGVAPSAPPDTGQPQPDIQPQIRRLMRDIDLSIRGVNA